MNRPNPIYEALADASLISWKAVKQRTALDGRDDLTAMCHVHRERGDRLVQVATVIATQHGPEAPRQAARIASTLFAPDVLVWTDDAFIKTVSMKEAGLHVEPGTLQEEWKRGERTDTSEALMIYVTGRTDSAFRSLAYQRTGIAIKWGRQLDGDSGEFLMGSVGMALRRHWDVPDDNVIRESIEAQLVKQGASPDEIEQMADTVAASLSQDLGYSVALISEVEE